MHSITTNDGRFYDKYDKFKADFWHMSRLKISTNMSNLVFISIHSNWGKNWSMKRKTSVMGVTTPLR